MKNNEDRIFALTPSASSTATIEGKDNVYPDVLHGPQPGFRLRYSTSLSKKLGTKIAVIWKNDDVYSKGIHETFVAKAEELGLEIVSDTTFADGNDTDFSVQLTDAQKNGADLVFLPMYYHARFSDPGPGQGHELRAQVVRRGRHGRHPDHGRLRHLPG